MKLLFSSRKEEGLLSAGILAYQFADVLERIALGFAQPFEHDGFGIADDDAGTAKPSQCIVLVGWIT